MIAQTLFYIVAALALAQVAAFAPFMGGFRVQRQASTEVRAAIDINMPALSSTMKEGKIVSWNKKIGEKVNSGDVLLVVESDKADMDVEVHPLASQYSLVPLSTYTNISTYTHTYTRRPSRRATWRPSIHPRGGAQMWAQWWR
jgi:hypothetical protein